jgi:hypothetical protein
MATSYRLFSAPEEIDGVPADRLVDGLSDTAGIRVGPFLAGEFLIERSCSPQRRNQHLVASFEKSLRQVFRAIVDKLTMVSGVAVV